MVKYPVRDYKLAMRVLLAQIELVDAEIRRAGYTGLINVHPTLHVSTEGVFLHASLKFDNDEQRGAFYAGLMSLSGEAEQRRAELAQVLPVVALVAKMTLKNERN